MAAAGSGQLADRGALETIAHYLELLRDGYLVAGLEKFSTLNWSDGVLSEVAELSAPRRDTTGRRRLRATPWRSRHQLDRFPLRGASQKLKVDWQEEFCSGVVSPSA